MRNTLISLLVSTLISTSLCHVFRQRHPDIPEDFVVSHGHHAPSGNTLLGKTQECENRPVNNIDFTCDSINAPDVKEFTLWYPTMKIGSEITNYYYMIFDLVEYGIDPDVRYHIIALRHHTSSDLLHHIATFTCGKDEVTPDTPEPVKDAIIPFEFCQMPVGLWSKENTTSGDNCYSDDFGIEIGKTGITKIYLQVHYNNPDRCNNLLDRAGMTFYYTENLRLNSAHTWILAADTFTIPPGRVSHVVRGNCYPECTNYLTEAITVTQYMGHMHAYGRKIHAEQRRHGVLIATFAEENPYSYYSPHIKPLSRPIVIEPGDQVTVICEYSTVDVHGSVTFGMATELNEMCIMYLMVYPGDAIQPKPICSEPQYCNRYQRGRFPLK